MVTPLVARARRAYGAHPLQLALLLASFALAGYAVQLVGLAALWNPETWWKSISVWFVGAALAHDLVLFPVYAAADRVLRVGARLVSTGARASRVQAVTYLRVPLLACGLITLLFFPGIIEQGSGAYTRATGQTQEPFLQRWLLLCAAILLVGLVAYLVARHRAPDVVAVSTSRGVADADESTTATQAPVSSWALLVLALLVLTRRRRVDAGSVSRTRDVR